MVKWQIEAQTFYMTMVNQLGLKVERIQIIFRKLFYI